MLELLNTVRPHTYLAAAGLFGRRSRTTMLLLLSLSLAGAVLAQPTPPVAADEEAVPRFYIEQIVVEGLTRAAPELIVAESRLRPGERYTELQLHEASYRVNRLPFVLETELALRRGSARGRFTLVLEVREIRRFFFGIEHVFSSFEPSVSVGKDDKIDVDQSFAPFAGVRLFGGRYNVFFAAASSDSGLQLGWDRYNFLRPGGLLRLAVEANDSGEVSFFPIGIDPALTNWQDDQASHRLAAETVLPVGGNHAVRIALSARRSGEGQRRETLDTLPDEPQRFPIYRFEDLQHEQFEIAWRYDTTDDAVFPTRGSSVTAAFDLQWLRADLAFQLRSSGGRSGSASQAFPTTRTRQLQATISAQHHWDLGRDQTFSVGLRLATGRTRIRNLPLTVDVLSEDGFTLVRREELGVWGTGVQVRHALRLWQSDALDQRADLWWESGVSLAFDGTAPDIGPVGEPLRTVRLETSIAFRNAWGVFRISFRLIDLDEGD